MGMAMTTLTEQARLWQLISPLLPVGAFHHSQGLEQAILRGWVTDETTTEAWVSGLLTQMVGYLDLAILGRVHSAWQQKQQSRVCHWNDIGLAYRETSELRDEDRNMGMALKRLAIELGQEVPAAALGFVAMFAVVAANAGITKENAAGGFAWAWCENQVAAAVKLIPLGHSAGQRIMWNLGLQVDSVVATGLSCADDEIGRSATSFALASALHETQYTRLFRS